MYKLLKRFGPLPEHLLAHYMYQILIGLQYLHNQGILHRDIKVRLFSGVKFDLSKGDNILLNKEGIVKLADFGSCSTLANDKKLTLNEVKGTPYW